ncbi:MAG: gliding motility-associated ABC transporter substrate-binding protein GldG [Bacteroidetes bacterium]|nr:gliding motility-associated ABC transporter substrate-binding protein GldG [Bacteroidota bacterium]
MKKRKDIIQLLLSVAIILLVNFISTFFFLRFDLTSDKRYTLSPATKEMLGKLDDIVYFKIYLEGDLPAGFDRLKTSTKEMLYEMRVHSHNNIEYEFINPNESPEKKKQNEIALQLMQKGLTPTYIEQKVEAGTSQQMIFPGAIASYKSGNKEFAVQLFKEQVGTPSEMQLSNSIQSLEYEISTTIRKLTMDMKAKIAFTEGHGELDSVYVADISKALSDYYSVSRIKLQGKIKNIEKINQQKAIIIAKPDSFFTEQNKFIIDQYIMQGGKVLWLVDGVYASMDSLRKAPETFAIKFPLGLDNQLFRYGVRINSNLVMDLRSGVIPVPVNNKYKLMPWFYFPLLAQSNNHPIVNNLNLVKGEFASTIDTVNVSGIKKTFLLSTSKYTSVQNTPAKIDIRTIFEEPDTRIFNQAYKPVAVLLEGEFQSLYKNHPLPGIDSIPQVKFKEKNVATKMIVVANGDIIKNVVQQSTNRAYPLGYDIYSQQIYGNKNFILNAVNYLCDDSGLLEVRSRELKLRMMDRKKVSEEKFKWQAINTSVPILLIIIFGIIQAVIRKKKFTL